MEIIFGHNAEVQQVLLLLSRSTDRLVFSAAQAHEVGAALIQYAECARGVTPSAPA